METKNKLIKIKDLDIVFDQIPVLDRINLEFNQGDQVALIGANGSGKTTLLKAILGLIKPDSGTINIDDNVTLGYLPQVLQITDRLFPMSVYEVVSQGILANKKFPKYLNKKDNLNINNYLEKFEIQELRDRRFGQLSMGQKQLVLFIRMMIQKPDIVFLDEPTSSLDVSKKDLLYRILEDLKKEKITYVIITHDLPSFNEHIKRVIYLEHKVLFDGDHKTFCENEDLSPFIHTHNHQEKHHGH